MIFKQTYHAVGRALGGQVSLDQVITSVSANFNHLAAPHPYATTDVCANFNNIHFFLQKPLTSISFCIHLQY